VVINRLSTILGLMIIFYHFQLYVIQGRYRGRIIPVAFGLMKNRRAPCYKKVWETLRDKVQNLTGQVLSPSKIVTDYEVSKLHPHLDCE
jgi:hypothetical protein